MIALLLDHLWQSTLFAGAAGLLTLAFTRNGAGIRYGLWFAASVKFLIPFAPLTALGGMLFRAFALAAPPPAFADMAPAAMPFAGPAPMFAAAPGEAIAWAPLLLALWALGFAIIFCLRATRWWKLRALVAAAAPSDIVAPLPVKLSAASLEPGLMGIWRPVLLLPHGITERLSPPELDAILAHEVCHLRRRDNLLAAIHMGVESLFWFHPLVWWLGAKLIAERENACDEAVLAAGKDAQVYAEGILKVCKLYLHSPLACASGVSGADLRTRIEAIMENRFVLPLTRVKKSLLAASAILALAAPLALGLLTTPPAIALTQAANAPHPGTEAVLRHRIEEWENRQPNPADLGDNLRETPQQRAVIQKQFDGWGALKSVSFVENLGPNDLYHVTFAHALTVWTVGPLKDGKIVDMHFAEAIQRDGKGPSPGLAATLRRELDGDFAGTPAFDLMLPPLQTATRQQWPRISADAKQLGAARTIAFQKINVEGWDIYHVTFVNGEATIWAQPLTGGKLNGLLMFGILLPKAPQHPGTEAWLRRDIAAEMKGAPIYAQMGPGLANATRMDLKTTASIYQPLGALQSLTFQGGNGNGGDVYEAIFRNGKLRYMLTQPGTDGKVNGFSIQRAG